MLDENLNVSCIIHALETLFKTIKCILKVFFTLHLKSTKADFYQTPANHSITAKQRRKTSHQTLLYLPVYCKSRLSLILKWDYAIARQVGGVQK